MWVNKNKDKLLMNIQWQPNKNQRKHDMKNDESL